MPARSGAPLSDKIDDTLDAYETLLPTVGAQLKDQVKSWTFTNREIAKSSIELGGSNHKDAREGTPAHGAGLPAGLSGIGSGQPGKTVEALRKELAGLPKLTLKPTLYIAPFVMDTRPGENLNYGWSFRKPGHRPYARAVRCQALDSNYAKAALADVMMVAQSAHRNTQSSSALTTPSRLTS